jgi:hypothetical protein
MKLKRSCEPRSYRKKFVVSQRNPIFSKLRGLWPHARLGLGSVNFFTTITNRAFASIAASSAF